MSAALSMLISPTIMTGRHVTGLAAGSPRMKSGYVIRLLEAVDPH